MNPWLIGLGALGGLGGLAGLTSGGPDYQHLWAMLQQMAGPQALMNNTQQLYNMNLASPAFQQQLQQLNLAGSQFGQNYGQLAAQQGMGGNTVQGGVNNAAQAGAPQMSSIYRQGAYGNLWNQSQQMAMQNLMARMNAMQGLQPGHSFGQQFGGLLGAGMQGLGDYYAAKGLQGNGNNMLQQRPNTSAMSGAFGQ